MGETNEALAGVLAAIEQLPDNVGLRIAAARLLIASERHSDAVAQLNAALASDSSNREVAALLLTASRGMLAEVGASDGGGVAEAETHDDGARQGGEVAEKAARQGPPSARPDFDWESAEAELASNVPAPFVDDAPAPSAIADRQIITLADVGGLERVKERLQESFLGPLRNPELARAFGKSLRGGLLLYGPPGCGKTYLARAVAGELGAGFQSVSVLDVIDSYIGQTEKNLHSVFERARRASPVVLFIDELDAIGARRSSMGMGHQTFRQMVNQLLLELDSLGANNEGLFFLGATNHPWDVDPALLRPGRFDRMILVLPPDSPARAEILRKAFAARPIAGIDIGAIAGKTAGFSGADLVHVVESASERAMSESMSRGELIPISMDHVWGVLREIKPSTTAWLDGARSVVDFANASGLYDDLADHLKRRRSR